MSQSVNDKRKDLLAAALRLFAENGFHGTPTSKIAKEAGVANGTLFHYYKTKEDLIVSLYIDIKTRMSEYIETNAEKEKSIKKNFRNQYMQVMLWSMDHGDEFNFIQQFHTSPFAALVPQEEIERLTGKSCEQIEKAIKDKAIKKRDINYIMTIFTSHTYGLHQYLSKTNFTEKDKKEIIKDSFDMLWKMLS
ncbi:MAG: TetR family transcriptional regulator [Flavobacterium psychrophilum]|nr:MAG: TetR family transcriptional regulator [Flavobacterium psychrophilum]